MEELLIETLSDKGWGRGFVKGKPIDVKGAFPGEKVQIKRNASRGVLLQILSPCPERVPYACLHAPSCGGCVFQGLSYETAVAKKEALYRELFFDQEVRFFPSDHPFGYRNKMEFTFQGGEGPSLGLIGSHGSVINLQECLLVSSWMEGVIELIRQWWGETTLLAYSPHRDEGCLRTLTCREATSGKMVLLTLSHHVEFAPQRKDVERLQAKIERFFNEPISLFLVIQHAVKGKETTFSEVHLLGPAQLEQSLLGFRYKISPRSFFQPNPEMAKRMIVDAIQKVNPSKEDRVVDLYCGVGVMGISFSPYVKEVIGVELNRYSAYDAKENIRLNDISNMRIEWGDVAQSFEKIGSQEVDLVIVDPPRQGLGTETIASLLRLNPKKILYFSCNPKSQKEDLLKLSEGYRIESLEGYDAFPMTIHIESVALLLRKDP